MGDSISSQSLKNLTIFNFAQTYANSHPGEKHLCKFFRRISQVFFEFWSRHVIVVRFDLLNFTMTSDMLFNRKVCWGVNKLVLLHLSLSAGYFY